VYSLGALESSKVNLRGILEKRLLSLPEENLWERVNHQQEGMSFESTGREDKVEKRVK